MSRRITILLAACAGGGLALSSAALGQYDTGFEVADGINASPSGTILTGQDGFYVPAGIDYWAMTYAGNTFGISQNPQGGAQFAAGQGQGSPDFSRGQRDMTWPAGSAVVTYDATCVYTGAPPASNNLGSFSPQPYPGGATYIHLFSWVDVNNPVAWKAFYLAYDVNGLAHAQPGMSPGAAWDNLPLNNWYEFTTHIDFVANRITRVTIKDLTTNQTSSFDPPDWYLEGGSGGGFPHPTGFRMFSGGGTAGNVVSFDNVDIAAGGPPPFTIALAGPCPGQKTLSWTGAGSGQMGIVVGNSQGSTTIPFGPCQGTVLGIQGGLLLYNVIGTQGGAGQVSGTVGGGACDKLVQCINTGSCDTSNVAGPI